MIYLTEEAQKQVDDFKNALCDITTANRQQMDPRLMVRAVACFVGDLLTSYYDEQGNLALVPALTLFNQELTQQVNYCLSHEANRQKGPSDVRH